MSAPGTVWSVNALPRSIQVGRTVFVATWKRDVSRNVLFRNQVSVWKVDIRIVVLRLEKGGFRLLKFRQGRHSPTLPIQGN